MKPTRLVLSRRPTETVIIGEGASLIEVTVIRIEGGQVCLGFTADRAVKIHRKELRDRINAERAAASASAAP